MMKEFEKNLERNLPYSRIAWTSSIGDSVSINDKVKQYQHLFDDPSRLPYYDEKGKYWQLSDKFNVEETEPAGGAVFHHPFLDKQL